MKINCPICNSTNFRKSLEGYSQRKTAGLNYLRGLDSDYLNNRDLILSKIDFYLCNDCGSGWRGDSLFSNKIDNLYHTKHSLHWKSFQLFRNFIEGISVNKEIEIFKKHIHNQSLFIEKKLDIIEFGNPLGGIGFSQAEFNLNKYNLKSHTRKNLGAQSILLWNENLNYFFILLYFIFCKVKKFIKLIIKKNNVLHNKKKTDKLLNKYINSICFLDIPTTIGWGTSSIICGISLLKWLLISNPSVKLSNLYKINSDIKYDLAICVNYIDHFDTPLILLRDILKYSEIILFNIHKQAQAGIQHKYTFPDNLDTVLTDKLGDNYCCIKLSNQIYKNNDYNFYLVGKTEYLLNFTEFIEE